MKMVRRKQIESYLHATTGVFKVLSSIDRISHPRPLMRQLGSLHTTALSLYTRRSPIQVLTKFDDA